MASSGDWFESVAEARAARPAAPAARRSTRRSRAGAERGHDARRQRRRLRRARAGRRASPTGRPPAREHGDHRDGPGDLAAGADLADRRAGGPPRRRGRGRPRRGRARHRDGAQLLRLASRSRRSSRPTRKTFFQIYWSATASGSRRALERARAAGAAGLIVTLDWSFSHRRDWGSPAIPEQARPAGRWLRLAPRGAGAARAGSLATLRARRAARPDRAEHGAAGRPAPTFFGAYGEWMRTPPPTWEDLAWLREQWGGPFMLKGVDRVPTTPGARSTSAPTAISVSNHGGNNLDGTPGLDPRPAGDRRGGRRRDRGPARRRHPPRLATWSRRWRSAPAR